MKHQSIKKWGNAVAGLALTALLIPTNVGVAQSPAPVGVNLFTNPGHEHPGAYFGGRGELNVSWNWTPFWEEPPTGTDLRDQNYRTPEFRPTFARDYPYRVNSGGGGDHWFNFFALNKAAGVMQVVEGLSPGQAVRYTSWVSLWSSNDNDPAIPPSSSRDGNMQIRACVLQDGGPRNMLSKELVCSPWAQPYDKWYQISVDATAKNNKVLAFVQSRAAVPVQHNDAFVDDSCFEILPSQGASGICLGQAYVPTGSSNGVKQQSKPIPPAPVAANERQNGSAYVNLPGFPSSVSGSNAIPASTAASVAVTAAPSPATSSPTISPIGSIKANVPVLNVRGGPGAQNPIVGTINQNEILPAIRQDGDWWSVLFNNNPAYVNAALVTFSANATATPTAAPSAATPAPANVTGIVKANVPVLNVRSGPGPQNQIIGTIKEGETLPASGQKGDWWVVTFNGNPAYVNGAFVSYTASSASPAPTAVTQPTPLTPPQSAPAVLPDLKSLGVVGVVYSKGQKLILLSDPNPSSNVIVEVQNNVNLAVLGKANDDFWTVLYKGNKVYVNADQVIFSDNIGLVTNDTIIAPPISLGNAPGLPAGPVPPVTPVPLALPEPAKAVLPPSGAGAATAGRVPQGANIRSQPNTSASIKQSLQYGEVIEVTGKTADGLWFEVRTPSGPGYVFASLTVPNEAANNAPVIQ